MKTLGLPRFNSFLEIEELKAFYDASATNIIFNIINHSEINKIAVPAFICEEIHLTFLSSNNIFKK